MWTQQGSLPLGLKKKDKNSVLRNDHCAKLKPKTRLFKCYEPQECDAKCLKPD